jgi:hypothetical protein
MKRISEAPFIFFVALIYGVSALLLPPLFEPILPIQGGRVIPGAVDQFETTINWSLVALLVSSSALIPAVQLIRRYSRIDLFVRTVAVVFLAELMAYLVVWWLTITHDIVPSGYEYGDAPFYMLISRIRDFYDELWPREINPYYFSAALRVCILPIMVLSISWLSKHRRFHALRGINA